MNIDFGLEGELTVLAAPSALLTTNLPPSATIVSTVLPVGVSVFPAAVVGSLSVASVPTGSITLIATPESIMGAVVSVTVPIASMEEILPDFIVTITLTPLLVEDGNKLLSEDGLQLE